MSEPTEAAAAVAEHVRDLNHTTPQGLTAIGDVYDTVGHLSTAALRLPQALEQIHAAVAELETSGRLRSDRGTLADELADIEGGLQEAATAAEHLQQALNRAHIALGAVGQQD